MGKITGFMELDRIREVALPVEERVRHYREFILTLKDDEQTTRDLLKQVNDQLEQITQVGNVDISTVQWSFARSRLLTLTVTPSMVRVSTPSRRARSENRTIRSGGSVTVGLRALVPTAIHTSKGACVPR